MAEKPKASSTPKIVGIDCRRRIGDIYNESVQSPINKSPSQRNESLRYRHNSHSEDEQSDCSVDSNYESDESVNKEEDLMNRRLCNCINCSSVIVIILLFISMIFLYCSGDVHKIEEISRTESLKKLFPSQVEDFWLHIEVAIKDISEFHHPKSLIFLYNDESEKTLNSILYNVSKFAVCALTNCSAIPIVLEGNDLTSTDIVKDYGQIISMNQKKLEDCGVMIVKNLEKICGILAQAFHSFCDEYNPLVENALFIFTMKVDTYPNDTLKFVEKHLYNLWKDLDPDKFHPLFTRISNIVLPIKVER